MLKAGRGKACQLNTTKNNNPPEPPALWPEGLTPFAYQLKCLPWVLARPATYLALDPGLGKTIVAAILLNLVSQKKPYLLYFVSPPSLVPNVEAEFSKWHTSTGVLRVIPDSRLSNPAYVATQIQKIDGDIFPKHQRILIVDEAHRFKTEKAKRTQALFQLAKSFDRVVFMSGTPMPNSRPIELWPILRRFAVDMFGSNLWAFAKAYCGAYEDKYGWHFDGFTNKADFKRRLFHTFMLRMRQEDVLELPELREGLLTVGDKMPAVVSAVERKVLKHFSQADLMEGKLAGMHLMTYLRLLGEYKVKFVLPFIEQILGDERKPVILFAHHAATIQALTLGLKKYRPTVITGKTPVKDRKAMVDKFQRDPTALVFIGNIEACGTGFTITKAARVILVEPSWRDGDNIQAIKRAHRIGQNNSVLAQYVVLKDSFDRKRMESLLTKRQNAV